MSDSSFIPEAASNRRPQWWRLSSLWEFILFSSKLSSNIQMPLLLRWKIILSLSLSFLIEMINICPFLSPSSDLVGIMTQYKILIKIPLRESHLMAELLLQLFFLIFLISQYFFHCADNRFLVKHFHNPSSNTHSTFDPSTTSFQSFCSSSLFLPVNLSCKYSRSPLVSSEMQASPQQCNHTNDSNVFNEIQQL